MGTKKDKISNGVDKINILGVNISIFDRCQTLNKIEDFLSSDGQRQLVTPNAEIILAAGRDAELLKILNGADLAVMDGSGPQLAAWLSGKFIERYPGADLTQDILKIASEKKCRIAILHCRPSISSKTDISKVLEKYSGLEFMIEEISRENTEVNYEKINNFAPQILLCTLGSSWQEKLIFNLLNDLPSVKIGIGVGGSFDFLTERIKRAPKLLRTLGLEWLWRLILEPWRIKRIYSAVIVFPLKFFIFYFKNLW